MHSAVIFCLLLISIFLWHSDVRFLLHAPVRDKQVAKCMPGRYYSLLCKRSVNRLHIGAAGVAVSSLLPGWQNLAMCADYIQGSAVLGQASSPLGGSLQAKRLKTMSQSKNRLKSMTGTRWGSSSYPRTSFALLRMYGVNFATL